MPLPPEEVTKFSALPAATAPAGGEVVPVVQGGTTKKMPVGAANGLATLDAGGKLPASQSRTDVRPLETLATDGFGLVNDAGASDQTAALNAAITATPWGGTLVLPPWRIKFSSLTVTNRIKIRGTSWYNACNEGFGSAGWAISSNLFGGTVLMSTATTGVAFWANNYNIHLEDFMLVGPGSGTSTGFQLGQLSVVAPTECMWRNIQVANFSLGYDFYWVEDSSFYGIRSRGCSSAIRLGDATNQNVFIDTEIQWSTVRGIYFNGAARGASMNYFLGGLFQNCSGVSIFEDFTCHNNKVCGFWFENQPGSSGFDIAGLNTLIADCALDFYSTQGIIRSAAKHVRLANLGEAGVAAQTLTIEAGARHTILDRALPSNTIVDNGTNTRYIPEPKVLSGKVFDYFARPNSTTTLGTADTGEAWVPLGGTWGVVNGQAYKPVASVSTTDNAVVETGKADTIVQAKIMAHEVLEGICFRAVDINNWWRLGSYNNTLYLTKMVAGVDTTVFTIARTLVLGDVYSVKLSGSTIVVMVNATVITTVTDAFNSTATKHGIHASGGGGAARLDDFSVA